MTTPRGRVVLRERAAEARPLFPQSEAPARRSRVAREELEARLDAERIVEQARGRAEAILAQARQEASSAAEAASRESRERAQAELAAGWLVLHRARGEELERQNDRVIVVATALAERLVGATLELHPGRVADLARVVIAEARGARRAVIEAHPLDAEALRVHLTEAGLDAQSVEIRADQALARGELRLHTDVGTIDAKLAPRLERLADALRDALP